MGAGDRIKGTVSVLSCPPVQMQKFTLRVCVGAVCMHHIALLTLHRAVGICGQPTSKVLRLLQLWQIPFRSPGFDMLWAWLLTLPTVLPHSAMAKPDNALSFVIAIASTVQKYYKSSSYDNSR